MVSESGTIKPQRRWLLETNSKLQISGGVEIPVSILRVVLDVPHMAWNGNYLESRPTRSPVSTMDVRPYNIGKLRKSMPSTSAIHVGGIDSAAALHHLSWSKETHVSDFKLWRSTPENRTCIVWCVGPQLAAGGCKAEE